MLEKTWEYFEYCNASAQGCLYQANYVFRLPKSYVVSAKARYAAEYLYIEYVEYMEQCGIGCKLIRNDVQQFRKG